VRPVAPVTSTVLAAPAVGGDCIAAQSRQLAPGGVEGARRPDAYNGRAGPAAPIGPPASPS
jgi:hypothetical protein